MKKTVASLPLSGLIFLMMIHLSGAVTPVSLFGSNPYFSSQLSPQDLLLRQGNYLYYYPHYQKAPWWGDIDEPANKPQTNADYTVTGVDIIDNNASFKHTGSIYTIANNLGYAALLRNNLMANFEFDYNIDAMRNSASGNMTGDASYRAANGTIPFEYSNRHTLQRLSFQGSVASTYRELPFGIKMSGGFQNTLSLKKELSFSKLKKIDSTTYDPNDPISYHFYNDQAKALWGWSTVGCNHIFGTKETQGDSWQQNSYSTGPLYHFDALAGITLPKVKAGLYYRFKSGHQDQYNWMEDTSVHIVDQVIANNFMGQYVKSDYSIVRSAWETRAFGNINHQARDRFSLNTFVSLGYIDSTNGTALSDNLSIPQYSKPQDAIRSLCLEVDPNINIRFGKFLNFLDAALLFEYRYSRYSNTSEQSVGRGLERAYNNSSVNGEDENVWENFSYANENSLHTGADFDMMFPVYSAFPHRLSLGFMLVGNVKYTFQTKYYGTTTASGSDLNFSVSNRRYNYKREVWFNTFLMAHYVQGPYQVRFEVTEPILYSFLPSTKITDAKGNGVIYEHEKSPLWISQLGMQAAVYASYDITMPFLRGLQKGQ
jgi:hypothetical protein